MPDKNDFTAGEWRDLIEAPCQAARAMSSLQDEEDAPLPAASALDFSPQGGDDFLRQVAEDTADYYASLDEAYPPSEGRVIGSCFDASAVLAAMVPIQVHDAYTRWVLDLATAAGRSDGGASQLNAEQRALLTRIGATLPPARRSDGESERPSPESQPQGASVSRPSNAGEPRASRRTMHPLGWLWALIPIAGLAYVIYRGAGGIGGFIVVALAIWLWHSLAKRGTFDTVTSRNASIAIFVVLTIPLACCACTATAIEWDEVGDDSPAIEIGRD